MADIDQLNDKVRRLVRTLLGMPENSIRPSDQNAPTGTTAEQFGTVKIISIRREGFDQILQGDEAAPSLNVREVIEGVRDIVASVQFYRGDAFTKACRLPALLQSSASIELMRTLGLGFVGTSEPRNLTTLVDTNREERGQIDLEFYVVAREAISLPTYGEFPVSIDLAIEKPDSTFYPPQTFEVSEP